MMMSSARRITPGYGITDRIDDNAVPGSYIVSLVSGQTYTFDVLGAESGGTLTLRDPFVTLKDMAGATIEFDDDSGDGLNARLIFTARQTADFRVEVSGFDGLGVYSLLINESADEGSDGGRGNVLVGTSNNDLFTAKNGDHVIDGGAGIDTVVYSGLFRSHAVDMNDGSGRVSAKSDSSSDVLQSVEQIRFDDGTLTFNPDSAEAAVMRLYAMILHRRPDPAGLSAWVQELRKGRSLVEVAAGFTNSVEFRQASGDLPNPAFVDFLYRSALGRAADPGGRATWIAALDAGSSRAEIVVSFSESAEHRALTADTLAEGLFVTDKNYQAVTALYDAFANRLPDAEGLRAWTERMDHHGLTLPLLADSFAASDEFTNLTQRMSNAELVDFMYHNTLDRQPDAGGRAAWIAALDQGLSRGGLLLSFSESNEHYDLIGANIYSGIRLAA